MGVKATGVAIAFRTPCTLGKMASVLSFSQLTQSRDPGGETFCICQSRWSRQYPCPFI